ncbi:MAG: fasciclin domain-containing protein [Bacteroidota bacterium]
MKNLLKISFLAIALFLQFSVYAQDKNLVETAIASKDHSTLVAAVKAAGLVDALSGEGPFTVFAPTNEAFSALPKGTVETLLKPENKEKLAQILTYHVLKGKLDSKTILKAIKKGKGKAEVETLSGGKLTAMLKDGKPVLQDEKGNIAAISTVDLMTSNGVIHVLNSVVLPK